MLEVSLSPHLALNEGDEVRLMLEPSHLLQATVLVYGLPLAGIVLMLMAGWLISRPLSDPEAIAYAVAGLAAGFITGRWQLNRRNCLKQFVPKIAGSADAAS